MQGFLEKEEFKRGIKDINLYMVDSSTHEKIYNFISNNKKMKMIKVESQPRLA